MTTTIEDYEFTEEMTELQEMTIGSETPAGATVDEQLLHMQLPWIGALANPRLGPLVVINDKGYLVPLFTAGDLLRGCRCLWRLERY